MRSLENLDLIEQIPGYLGKEHPILSKCWAGNWKDELHNPRRVAFNKIQNILYICDRSNHRIQVFNTNGKFLHSFGSNQLQGPHGICLSKDFVFVSDEANKCVTKFTHEGKLNNTFDGTVKFGRNLGIDCYGEFVYICDVSFQRIHRRRSWGGRGGRSPPKDFIEGRRYPYVPPIF